LTALNLSAWQGCTGFPANLKVCTNAKKVDNHCARDCGSIETKLSRLDACEDWKVVCWCRMQASSHNSQDVDSEVNEAGMITVATDRSTVLYGWMDQG